MALRNPIPKFPHRSNVLITDATVEPVSPAELRVFLKEDAATLGDSEAMALIKFARNYLENTFGLIFITQTWEAHYDRWPGSREPWWDGVQEGHINVLSGGAPYPLELPFFPLISVVTCTVYDLNDVAAAVNVSNVFNIDTASRPGRMHLKSGQTWPTAARSYDAIVIRYTAGFGATADTVPATLRDAVLLLASYYKEHRGECSMMEMASKSGAIDLMRVYAPRAL